MLAVIVGALLCAQAALSHPMAMPMAAPGPMPMPMPMPSGPDPYAYANPAYGYSGPSADAYSAFGGPLAISEAYPSAFSIYPGVGRQGPQPGPMPYAYAQPDPYNIPNYSFSF